MQAGFDADFNYPEHELREELHGEKARLEAQVREMDRQVSIRDGLLSLFCFVQHLMTELPVSCCARQLDALEQERVRLLRDLRNNAADISEKGVKFVGLTPEQLSQVNEFACNLRDGKIELPKASSPDGTENKRLRQTIFSLESKVSALQSELALQSCSRAAQSEHGAERDAVTAMREDLSRLLAENAELHTQLQKMHVRVALL